MPTSSQKKLPLRIGQTTTTTTTLPSAVPSLLSNPVTLLRLEFAFKLFITRTGLSRILCCCTILIKTKTASFFAPVFEKFQKVCFFNADHRLRQKISDTLTPKNQHQKPTCLFCHCLPLKRRKLVRENFYLSRF